MATESTGALDTPAFDRAVLSRPHHRSGVPIAVVGEMGVTELAASQIEQSGRERAAVWVDTDDVARRHGVASKVSNVSGKNRATTSQSRVSDALIKSARFSVTEPKSTLQTQD